MMNFLKTSAVAAVVAIAPMTASAVTILDGGSTVINQSETYTGAVFVAPTAAVPMGATGMGMWQHKFEAEFGSATQATVGVTIGASTIATFSDLSVSWLAVDGMQVFSDPTVDLTGGFEALSTSFGEDPDNVQYLKFAWSSSSVGNGFDFDVSVNVDDVAPVPVPAAGLMLLTALGGAAAMRRRTK